VKKSEKRILWGLLGLAVLVQFIPIPRNNPPVTEDVSAPAEVKAILRSSCFDCHSNETRWPFYGYVAPVSWLLAYDVHEARSHLNFSEWDRYSENARTYLKNHVVNMIETGKMPPPQYRIMHRGAAVTPSELAVLKEWANPPAPPSETGESTAP
jgi:hypothetical protein